MKKRFIKVYVYFMFYNTMWASLLAQMVKNLPAMLETQI